MVSDPIHQLPDGSLDLWHQHMRCLKIISIDPGPAS
jgi:hypothetical protein